MQKKHSSVKHFVAGFLKLGDMYFNVMYSNDMYFNFMYFNVSLHFVIIIFKRLKYQFWTMENCTKQLFCLWKFADVGAFFDSVVRGFRGQLEKTAGRLLTNVFFTRSNIPQSIQKNIKTNYPCVIRTIWSKDFQTSIIYIYLSHIYGQISHLY